MFRFLDKRIIFDYLYMHSCFAFFGVFCLFFVNKELTLLVFGCSMFRFLDKRIIFISFIVFFVCFFI